MKTKLYYFTIDLIINQYNLTCPNEISDKVYKEFGEKIPIHKIKQYLKKNNINELLTLKTIFG